MEREFKQAFLISWGVITILMAAALMLPFIIQDEGILLSHVPQCEMKASGGAECATCGLTRGFISVSKGDLASAYNANSSVLLVYLIFVINIFIFLYMSFKKRALLKTFNN